MNLQADVLLRLSPELRAGKDGSPPRIQVNYLGVKGLGLGGLRFRSFGLFSLGFRDFGFRVCQINYDPF